MEPREVGNLDLRGLIAVAAVALALWGISAALATKEQPETAPAASPAAASTYGDPSLSGLSVGGDADPGGDVEMYN